MSNIAQLMSFQNDILSQFQQLEKKIDLKFEQSNSNLIEKMSIIDSQISAFSQRIDNLENKIPKDYEDYKSKIESLEKSNTYIEGEVQGIKINNAILDKDLKDAIYRYDKAIKDNLILPGLVGKGCMYQTFKEYILYTNKSIEELKFYKESNAENQKEYQQKIENLITTFKYQYNNFLSANKEYTDLKIEETRNYFDTGLEYYKNHLADIRLDNSALAVKLEQMISSLTKDWGKVASMKKDVMETMDKNIKNVKGFTLQISKSYDRYISEFKVIKDKFFELAEFIQDVRFRRNLFNATGEVVTKRDTKNMASSINISMSSKGRKSYDKKYTMENNFTNNLQKFIHGDIDFNDIVSDPNVFGNSLNVQTSNKEKFDKKSFMRKSTASINSFNNLRFNMGFNSKNNSSKNVNSNDLEKDSNIAIKKLRTSVRYEDNFCNKLMSQFMDDKANIENELINNKGSSSNQSQKNRSNTVNKNFKKMNTSVSFFKKNTNTNSELNNMKNRFKSSQIEPIDDYDNEDDDFMAKKIDESKKSSKLNLNLNKENTIKENDSESKSNTSVLTATIIKDNLEIAKGNKPKENAETPQVNNVNGSLKSINDSKDKDGSLDKIKPRDLNVENKNNKGENKNNTSLDKGSITPIKIYNADNFEADKKREVGGKQSNTLINEMNQNSTKFQNKKEIIANTNPNTQSNTNTINIKIINNKDTKLVPQASSKTTIIAKSNQTANPIQSKYKPNEKATKVNIISLQMGQNEKNDEDDNITIQAYPNHEKFAKTFYGARMYNIKNQFPKNSRGNSGYQRNIYTNPEYSFNNNKVNSNGYPNLKITAQMASKLGLFNNLVPNGSNRYNQNNQGFYSRNMSGSKSCNNFIGQNANTPYGKHQINNGKIVNINSYAGTNNNKNISGKRKENDAEMGKGGVKRNDKFSIYKMIEENNTNNEENKNFLMIKGENMGK